MEIFITINVNIINVALLFFFKLKIRTTDRFMELKRLQKIQLENPFQVQMTFNYTQI